MTIKNGDMPASPSDFNFINQLGKNIHEMNTGLTKREAFAMAAMQGILANSEPNSWSEEQWYERFSSQAVNHADALLKELSK